MTKVQKAAKGTLGKLDRKFNVMEIFRTIQGEGTDVGRETIFLRLSVCNLACVWCDTKDSWTTKGTKERLSVEDIVRRFHDLDPGHELTHYVITGGEPLLHDHDLLHELQNALRREGWLKGTFETNGTIIPEYPLQFSNWLFSVSPKLESSDNGEYPIDLLEKWVKVSDVCKVQFKFVVANPVDAAEVSRMIWKLAYNVGWQAIPPIIFQPEESANNYRELPSLMEAMFHTYGVKKSKLDVRYIPQIHKMTGWH